MYLRFARFGAKLTTTLLIAFLGACAPDTKDSSAGHISLVQSGTSESGLLFVLENDTSRPVFFRGWTNKDAAPMPSYSGSCYGDTASGRSTNAFVGAPPEHTIPKRIKVESGARLQLIVANDDLEHFKGDRCRITLEFEEGLTVESTPFVP
jgi:hypothetical protein